MRTNTKKSKASNNTYNKPCSLRQIASLSLAEQLLYFICDKEAFKSKGYPCGKINLKSLSNYYFFPSQNKDIRQIAKAIIKSNYIEIGNQIITVFDYFIPSKEHDQYFYNYQLHKKIRSYLYLFQKTFQEVESNPLHQLTKEKSSYLAPPLSAEEQDLIEQIYISNKPPFHA